MTVASQLQCALHLGHFPLAANELRQPPPRRKFKMAAQRSSADHLVDVDWLADAFDLGRPEVAQLEVTLDQTPRILANYDATCWRNRLHPRREVGRMSYRSVLSMPAGMYHAQDHFAGVNPDADFEWHRL